MKNYYSLFLIYFLILPSCLCQNNKDNYIVEYKTYYNNGLINIDNPKVLVANTNEALITSNKNLEKTNKSFPLEDFYIDLIENKLYHIAQLNKKEKVVYAESISPENNKIIIENHTKKILGYNCTKASITINSNLFEIWFTTDLPIKGSPTTLGYNLGLVLEITKNNNYKIVASKITPAVFFNIRTHISINNTQMYDRLTYKEKIWQAGFTQIPIFENEIINYSDSTKSTNDILRFANGTVIAKKIKIPDFRDGSQIFIDLNEESNGDAYDRTGSVFIIPNWNDISFLDALDKGIDILPVYKSNNKLYQGTIATPNYTPPIELMRFFTPFGIGKFNHIEIKNKNWQKSSNYRQDISSFAPLLKDREVYIGVYIGNFDKGGHKISANITIHPSELSIQQYTFIMPLFNTLNVMEAAGQTHPTMFNSNKGVTVEFELQNDVRNAQLRYITTGHGGWENGDEFNPKENRIILDGQEIISLIPWREDCGSYRLYNPASGNFKDGLSSSDLSRSNWCPGTVTSPTYINLGNLSEGKHSIKILINQGKSEGDSFSFWNISGTIFGFEWGDDTKKPN